MTACIVVGPAAAVPLGSREPYLLIVTGVPSGSTRANFVMASLLNLMQPELTSRPGAQSPAA